MLLTRTSAVSAAPTIQAQSPTLSQLRDNSTFWIVAAALVAFTLKLIIALNTFGTNDVIAFYRFGASLSEHGLQWTYQNVIAFNHPPLVAYYLEAIFKLSHLTFFERNDITFPFLLRLPGIIADFITVLVLIRALRVSEWKIPRWALYLFALSPVSLMVSGFHGNTDSIMVLFLVLAVYMVLRQRPIVCALFFILSCQIKVIPFLFVPIFFFYWHAHRQHLRFSFATVLATLIFWSVPLSTFPMIFVRRVLTYGSFWGLWGITYWLRLAGWPPFAKVTFHDLFPEQNLVANALKLTIIVAVLLIAWRRRSVPAATFCGSIAYGWIVFFILSPGVGAQYMAWLAPFVLILSPVFYGFLTLTSAVFLFFFYNAISFGFPWYMGISEGQHLQKWMPWSIWPWAVLVAGIIVSWRTALAKDPALRLLSLRQGQAT